MIDELRRTRGRSGLRWLGRVVVPLLALSGCALSGCFVLFPLDDYPGSPSEEAGPVAGGDAATEGSADVAPPQDGSAPFDGRVVFVLDPFIAGDSIASLAAADSLCTKAARSADLPDASYKAWLGDRNASVAARFGAFDGGRTIRLIMPDRSRTVLASGLDELADSGPRVPIVVTAAGKTLPISDAGCVEGGLVWTDTNADGTLISLFGDCTQWTTNTTVGGAGAFGATEAGAWTTGCGYVTCNTPGYLYCVEQ
jgi:hypothetical protein